MPIIYLNIIIAHKILVSKLSACLNVVNQSSLFVKERVMSIWNRFRFNTSQEPGMGISRIAERIVLYPIVNLVEDLTFSLTPVYIGTSSEMRNFKNYNFSLKNRIFRPSFGSLLTNNKVLKVQFFIVTT